MSKGRKSPLSSSKLLPSFLFYQTLQAAILSVMSCQLVRLISLLETVYHDPMNEEFQACQAAAQTARAVDTFFHLLVAGPDATRAASGLARLLRATAQSASC